VQQAAAAAVILLCWLATVRSRKPREQINYRILPQDYRVIKSEDVRRSAREQSFDLEDTPASSSAATASTPEQTARRRFTEQDAKAQEAFKDYLETL
jgi:hypothetical protein